MPNIGTISVDLHTVDRDETVYKGPTHNVTHKDLYAFRRALPTTAVGIQRAQLRAERGFPVTNSTDGLEKTVTVSIAVVVPPGIDSEAAETYVSTVLTQAAATVGEVAVTGDIHL